MILALLGLAYAGSAADIVRQRQVVDQAAASVAEGRAEGLRRTEIAELMAKYRAAAAELERLEAAAGPPAAVYAERHAAVDALRTAVAEGTQSPAARALIAAWLGAPADRLSVLAAAVDGAAGSPDAIRRGVMLDVVDQSDALAVLLEYDAAIADASRQTLELRAATLRRRAPGQTPSMSDEVEAVRALEQASSAAADAKALRALRVQVTAVRDRAAQGIGGQP